MKKNQFTSIFTIYKLTLELAGDKENEFKKSLIYFTLAFVSQGLAFGMFYPMLKSMFAETFILSNTFLYLGVMALFSVISFWAKWKGHDFDYTGNIVEISHDIRTKLGVALRKMPLEKLSRYKTGELNSIFSSNVDESVLHMGMIASMFLQIIIVPITIVIFTFFVDYRLALLILLILPFAIPLYNWKRNDSNKEKVEFNKANAILEADFIEYIQGLPVLRAVNKVGVNAQNLHDSIAHVKEVQKEGLNKGQIPFVLMGILIEITLLALVFICSYFILDNSLSIITLAAAVIVVSRLSEPLSIFLGVVSVFDIMDSAFNRIKAIFAINPLIIEKPYQEAETFDITFDNVSFAYENQKTNALKKVSFSMPNKTMTAIVGHSGCGKTTLTKMIMRYSDPQTGSIKIGGINIKNMSSIDLMKNISVVFQDVYLFDDTIMNNIRMANQNATDKEVEIAAQSAFCHEFISRLPAGYNTTIGDIGGSLSGGEKQRISIARAILKNAPIVILDEPTAALDTQSEVAVQKAIDKLLEDKTVIVIAHRLSTISSADNILVLDNGEVIEMGTHNELVNNKDKYFDMWSAQQRVKEWSLDA
ncbi:ABC transporter ATP-binding protein [Arcobacter sp.]|uniref:ABC transporter ATP-binding protein n=1 Tax=unclassified Arcobacter TaxID=2593671 RepID=UPI003AFF7FC6